MENLLLPEQVCEWPPLQTHTGVLYTAANCLLCALTSTGVYLPFPCTQGTAWSQALMNRQVMTTLSCKDMQAQCQVLLQKTHLHKGSDDLLEGRKDLQRDLD